MTCLEQQIKETETKVHLLVALLNLAAPQLPALIMQVKRTMQFPLQSREWS